MSEEAALPSRGGGGGSGGGGSSGAARCTGPMLAEAKRRWATALGRCGERAAGVASLGNAPGAPVSPSSPSSSELSQPQSYDSAALCVRRCVCGGDACTSPLGAKPGCEEVSGSEQRVARRA